MNVEQYVEDWCLEHECEPEDLDLEVIELQTLTTKMVRDYLPQYRANTTKKYNQWFWRKIVTFIKDCGAPMDTYVFAQVQAAKNWFNPNWLLKEAAKVEYEQYLESSNLELAELYKEYIDYVLQISRTIKPDALFSRPTNDYDAVFMYSIYVLMYTSSTDADVTMKYVGLANDLLESAKQDFKRLTTRTAILEAWGDYGEPGLRVKEILANTLA